LVDISEDNAVPIITANIKIIIIFIVAIIIIYPHYGGTESSENYVLLPDYTVSYLFLCITKSIFKTTFDTNIFHFYPPVYSIFVGVNQ